jgi:hypothetical protein
MKGPRKLLEPAAGAGALRRGRWDRRTGHEAARGASGRVSPAARPPRGLGSVHARLCGRRWGGGDGGRRRARPVPRARRRPPARAQRLSRSQVPRAPPLPAARGARRFDRRRQAGRGENSCGYTDGRARKQARAPSGSAAARHRAEALGRRRRGRGRARRRGGRGAGLGRGDPHLVVAGRGRGRGRGRRGERVGRKGSGRRRMCRGGQALGPRRGGAPAPASQAALPAPLTGP